MCSVCTCLHVCLREQRTCTELAFLLYLLLLGDANWQELTENLKQHKIKPAIILQIYHIHSFFHGSNRSYNTNNPNNRSGKICTSSTTFELTLWTLAIPNMHNWDCRIVHIPLISQKTHVFQPLKCILILKVKRLGYLSSRIIATNTPDICSKPRNHLLNRMRLEVIGLITIPSVDKYKFWLCRLTLWIQYVFSYQVLIIKNQLYFYLFFPMSFPKLKMNFLETTAVVQCNITLPVCYVSAKPKRSCFFHISLYFYIYFSIRQVRCWIVDRNVEAEN